ncbi:MAG: hypothetical protein WC683_18580 [bacterium]
MNDVVDIETLAAEVVAKERADALAAWEVERDRLARIHSDYMVGGLVRKAFQVKEARIRHLKAKPRG